MEFADIKKYLADDLSKVSGVIESSLRSDIPLLDKTNGTLLSHLGKQLRPVLALLVAKACSGGSITEDTVFYAAASELLHNATLLHDDVADNSPERRGQPTVMSLLGGRASVLLGDYWLVKGVDNILSGKTSSEHVIRIFSRTLSDLARGELLQLQKADSGDTDEEDYYRIIYYKTASLFVSTALSAAISVGSPENKIQASSDFAKYLGIAFQIKDDIFDYTGGPDLGKPAGQDIKERKITLPLLGAFANVSPEKERDIRSKISCIADNPEYQNDILLFVRQNGGLEYAETRLEEYIIKAKESIAVLGEGRDIDILSSLADFVGNRKS